LLQVEDVGPLPPQAALVDVPVLCQAEDMYAAAHRNRYYPTEEEADLFARTFGCVRFVYNRGRAMREEAWKHGKQKCGLYETKRMLPIWKKDPGLSWLKAVSAVPLQQAMYHLQAAYKNFFEKRARYPRFKRKDERQAAEFTKAAFIYRDGKLTLAKMAQPLDIRWSRDLPCEPSTVTVIREADGRWYVACRVEVSPDPLEGGRDHVGVDLGLTDLITLSTGEKIPNPRHLKKRQRRLAREQRCLVRKQKGSRNRAKAKWKVARAHSAVRRARRDFHHKLSTRLVRENQAITVETLNIRGMVKNKHLAKAIHDAAWGELIRQIKYKCVWYGRDFSQTRRFFPGTKTCSACGTAGHVLPLSRRTWTCPDCGTLHDRDINAAKNHEAAGRRHRPAERRSVGRPKGRTLVARKQECRVVRHGSPRLQAGE
jgi:putative transposase